METWHWWRLGIGGDSDHVDTYVITLEKIPAHGTEFCKRPLGRHDALDVRCFVSFAYDRHRQDSKSCEADKPITLWT